MLAVIGLGNPGKEYEKTRHNIGFMVLQALADEFGQSFRKEERFEGFRLKAQGVEFLMPATYMNESGRAVQKLLRYFQIAPSKVLVVVDDMDLPFGEMRLKAFGGSGGHNGLKSLEAHLGTSHFARLRIGIGRPVVGASADFVLGTFSQEEQKQLPEVIEAATGCVKRLFVEELAKVATDVNRPKASVKIEKDKV